MDNNIISIVGRDMLGAFGCVMGVVGGRKQQLAKAMAFTESRVRNYTTCTSKPLSLVLPPSANPSFSTDINSMRGVFYGGLGSAGSIPVSISSPCDTERARGARGL